MTILLIEDDESVCTKFQRCIEAAEGMELCAVTNDANQGIELTQYHLPDVVILDLELHLGGGNGLEYLSNLQHLQLPHRPLVAVTTNNTSQIILESARTLGASIILTKYEKNYSESYVLNTLRLTQHALEHTAVSDSPAPVASPADREQSIRTYLHKQFSHIGISPKLKGYDYLVDSIIIISQDPHAIVSKVLSKKYAKSASSIERAMQTAIKRTWVTSDPQDLAMYYTAYINPNRGEPSLMEFIHYYAKQVAEMWG